MIWRSQRVDITTDSGFKTIELCEMSLPCLSSRQERPAYVAWGVVG
jgi:hypothetical protein